MLYSCPICTCLSDARLIIIERGSLLCRAQDKGCPKETRLAKVIIYADVMAELQPPAECLVGAQERRTQNLDHSQIQRS